MRQADDAVAEPDPQLGGLDEVARQLRAIEEDETRPGLERYRARVESRTITRCIYLLAGKVVILATVLAFAIKGGRRAMITAAAIGATGSAVAVSGALVNTPDIESVPVPTAATQTIHTHRPAPTTQPLHLKPAVTATTPHHAPAKTPASQAAADPEPSSPPRRVRVSGASPTSTPPRPTHLPSPEPTTPPATILPTVQRTLPPTSPPPVSPTGQQPPRIQLPTQLPVTLPSIQMPLPIGLPPITLP